MVITYIPRRRRNLSGMQAAWSTALMTGTNDIFIAVAFLDCQRYCAADLELLSNLDQEAAGQLLQYSECENERLLNEMDRYKTYSGK